VWVIRNLFDRTRGRLESRTAVWREVGLGDEINRQEAKRARSGALISAVLIAAVIVGYSNRKGWFPGYGPEVRVATVVSLIVLGWTFARALGRGIGPTLYKRLDPGAAGTMGFLVRLVTVLVVIFFALRIAGLSPTTLAAGGAFTAVLVGLASQQVLSNLIAGLVLLGTRPFRVGERVKLIGGAYAGQVEGIVGSFGLFYTTLISGADRMMVPNSMLLTSVVTPMREPERVELRARFGDSTSPRQVQDVLEEVIEVPMRYPPHIAVEELDQNEVVARIVATPINPADGGRLAEEVLAGVRRANETPDGNGNGTRPRREKGEVRA
jgi:small-conductance mechanosensitive channel